MPWFRVDDKFGEHPKVRAIPRSRRRNAIGLWLLAGSWCALNYKQDGHVPGYMVEELCAELDDAVELARVGLWHATGHDCAECEQPREVDGFLFHDWAHLQPSRADVEAKRAADAERQRQHRERKKAEREAAQGTVTPVADRHESVTRDDSVSHGPVRSSRPDPTRPDPARPSVGQVGGHRYETLPASGGTMRPEDARCAKHEGALTDPGPCRGCMKAREAAERAEKAGAEARAAALRDCETCGGSGWIETEDGAPIRKCDHRGGGPTLAVVR